MSVAEKVQWREWCQSDPNIHIFMRDWWLDAVCGADNWDCIIESSEYSGGGQSRAALPFYKIKSHGFNVIAQPILTQKIGPYVKLEEGLSEQESADMSNQLLGKLLDRLPTDVASVNFNMDWHITDGEPFLARGYEVTTRYTNVLLDLSDLDSVYASFDKTVRKHLRRAEQIVKIEETDDIEAFYQVNGKTFHRQGKEIPYSFDFVKQLDEVLVRHQARKIFLGKDEQGRIHAANYLIWDENSMYLLMGSADPELRESHAGNLMVWNGIKFASTVTKHFDFEGSMLPGVNAFNLAFAPVNMPYLSVSKRQNKLYNLLWHGKQVVANLI